MRIPRGAEPVHEHTSPASPAPGPGSHATADSGSDSDAEVRPDAVDRMHLRVVTLNIRYATTTPSAGEHPWSTRCPKLCNQLAFTTAGRDDGAFLCLQEVLRGQLDDILRGLGSAWSHIGRGRDDGLAAGEHSPVLYRRDVWRCEADATRWLSEDPLRPSTGWDAALPRVVTMGRFVHRRNGARVVVMSTHLDHVGVEARVNSARLILEWAGAWGRIPGEREPAAVLVGGDFNSTTQDGAYRVMTAPGSSMADVARLVPQERHYGNTLTYTSFGEPEEWPQRIDFLFLRQPTTALARTFGVLANSFDDQIRISDHRAVVSDLDIVV